MNPNLRDVVHDLTAAIAQNNTSDPGWVRIQQVTASEVNMCIANHHEMTSAKCMEMIANREAVDVMQLNTTRTKVQFNEHAHDHLSHDTKFFS